MTYKAKLTFYAEIRKKTLNAKHHVEFFNVKPGGT